MRAWLAVAAIAIYFCFMAWPGLNSGFSHDDLMNITFAMRDGWAKIIRGNFLFFTTQYRPLGCVYYLGLYDTFGLTPLAFRVVGIAVLALNVFLLYRLTRLVTASVEAGLYAAVLIVWHGNFGPLFFGSGNIYDALGFCCYIATLGVYVPARQKGQLSVRSLAAMAALQICAMNSKEFSASIPLLILSTELIFHRSAIAWRGIIVSATLSGIYTLGKVLGPDSLTAQSAYAPRLSVGAYMESLIMFQNDLTYKSSWATPWTATWFLIILIAVPALLRNRAMWFGAAIVTLAPLPVMLISPRGLASHYLTVGGLALWGSALIADLRQRLSTAVRTSEWEERYLQAAVFTALFLVVLKTHAPELPFQTEVYWKEGRLIMQAMTSAKQHPEWWSVRDRKILILSDPFNDEWPSVFLGMLVAHNPHLRISRLPSMNPTPSREDLKQFGLFLKWDGSQYVQTTAPAFP